MRLDPVAASLYPLLDDEWQAKTRHAGWLMFLPVVGWPMVLGYRKALIEHFHWPKDRAMPAWSGRHREHCVNGLRAIAVIQAYLSPLWIALGSIAWSRDFAPGAGTWLACAVCALVLTFTNIAFPVATMALSLPVAGGPYLERSEAAGLMALFHAVIFLVPAGFLRVSATGRFRSALNLTKTVPFVIRRWRDYLRAWWYGLFMNLPPLPLFPVAPWGLFWGYVASVALFNQLLLDEPAESAPERQREASWLLRSIVDPAETDGVRILRSRFVTVPLPVRQ